MENENKNKKNTQPKKTKKKGKSRLKKIFITILTLAVIGTISAVGYSFIVLDRIKGDEMQPKKVATNKPVNILLLGVDAGEYGSKSKKNPKRSDTMMLIRYNPSDNKAYILSIPRDTKVRINGDTHKLNAAHAIGGVPLTVKTIEDLLDVEINYYAKIDYEGFRECIDAIGGIDVKIEQDMNYDADDIKIHFKKGETVHLDGEKAEQFVRWRKNNNGGGYKMGDLGRISTQQDFMIKVIEKLKTPAGIVRLPKVADTVSKYVNTNMDSKKIMEYMLEVKSVDINNIERRLLEGTPKEIANASYFIYDKEKSAEYLSNFKSSSTASSQKGKNSIVKSDIKITVLNSTGVNGLASKYKNILEEKGYKVVETGNYGKKLKTTQIKEYSEKEAGEEISSDIGFGTVLKGKESSNSDIVIILGSDSLK